jgi:hypothetical protein
LGDGYPTQRFSVNPFVLNAHRSEKCLGKLTCLGQSKRQGTQGVGAIGYAFDAHCRR